MSDLALVVVGAIAAAMGLILLAFMLWITAWAGLKNLDLVAAFEQGEANYVLGHWGAILVAAALIWFGIKAALGRKSA